MVSIEPEAMKHVQQQQEAGAASEERLLLHEGIQPLTMDALPWYAAWSRSELAGILVVLSHIEGHLRFIARLLKWILAVLIVLAVWALSYSR